MRTPRVVAAKAPPVRKRREPEAARREILDAAERVFAERGPDAVGLKDVARAAGVSHALVTHYFGTYDALVEATLERRVDRVRAAALEKLAAAGAVPEPGELLALAFELANDPVQARLAMWALLSGRSAHADFFATRQRGMARVVDAVLAALARDGRAASEALRRDAEFAVLLGVSAAYGYGVGKHAFLAALGRKSSVDEDAEFAARLGEVLKGVLAPEAKPRRPPHKR